MKAADSTNSEDFKRECRVLSYLNHVEHPNIIELLGSYTHNGIHSLIFPVAEYDLNELLKGRPISSFRSQSDYLVALCGLASALNTLHSFSSKTLDVSLIGCHHDLRPYNVLVKGRQFLFADFGLTTLKDGTESSKSMRRPGDSRYLAPECEDLDKDFEPHKVGRKSDIWSFGCVLLELLTYIMQDSDAVRDFERSREVTVAGYWTFYPFHSGRQPHQKVEAKLTELEKYATTAYKGVIRLARDMLHIEPDDRPNADQVTHHLRFWTLESIFSKVYNALEKMVPHENDLNMIVERERLLFWAQVMGIRGSTSQDGTENLLATDDIFYRIFQDFEKIDQDVTARTMPYDDSRATLTRLRMIIDDIVYALPAKFQMTISSVLEQKLLSTDDLGILQEVRQTFDETSKYRSIGTLAAVKYMHELCEAPTGSYGRRMQLKSVSSKPLKVFDHFTIDEFVADGGPPTLALVERIQYAEHWVSTLGNELFDRIGAVLELLRTASRSDKKMRLLSPRGWSHEPENRTFKMAFNIPGLAESGENKTPRIMTLSQHIEQTVNHRPALEDRLMLARQLAAALSRLHKVKWVHKNISAFSIIFSQPSHGRSQALPPPYLIGFNYSRPNNPDSWSEMPSYRIEVTDYCHPEYSTQIKRIRYQTRFDWYSLGLVMLEIGLWRTLDSMTKEKKTLEPQELLEFILQKHVPRLDFYMGKGYRRIIENCLKGQIGMDSMVEEGAGTEPGRLTFTQSVEEQLARCSPLYLLD